MITRLLHVLLSPSAPSLTLGPKAKGLAFPTPVQNPVVQHARPPPSCIDELAYFGTQISTSLSLARTAYIYLSCLLLLLLLLLVAVGGSSHHISLCYYYLLRIRLAKDTVTSPCLVGIDTTRDLTTHTYKAPTD